MERRAVLPSDMTRGFLSSRHMASVVALSTVAGKSGVDVRIHRWTGARRWQPGKPLTYFVFSFVKLFHL